MTLLKIESSLHNLVANFDKESFIYEYLHSTIDALKSSKNVTKHSSRFIIVADFQTLFAYDTKAEDSFDTEQVLGVLGERGRHSQKTLAQLYDPDKMLEGLRKAHQTLDIYIEQCYRTKPFENDEERLEYLFRMYEEMTSK